MADIVDPATRSRMMGGIRGKNTAPEMLLRRALHARGFRFRLHDRKMPGSPDIVLPKWKAVILVHGCFWHRHAGCRFATTPKTRASFWEDKFRVNVDRDRRSVESLLDAGWRVGIVWECRLKSDGADQIAETLTSWLGNASQQLIEL